MMSGFVMFVLALTFAYVVYFSVMITIDIHGKKDVKKSEEDTYDVSDMADEEMPVSVAEHNDDSEGNGMTYTEHVTDDGLRVINPTNNVPSSNQPLPEDAGDVEKESSAVTSAEINAANEEDMEMIVTSYQCSYVADEFMQSLNDKHKRRKIERKNAIDRV